MGLICLRCKKPNHFAVACRSNKQNTGCYELAEEVSSDSSVSVDTLFVINYIDKRAWDKSVKLEGINIKMELDTGSEVNIVLYDFIKLHGLKNNIKKNPAKLEIFLDMKFVLLDIMKLTLGLTLELF